MYRVKILDFFSHSAFISLLLWFVLILLIPIHTSRYKIKAVSEEYYSPNTYFIYHDLDSDGSSEKISIDLCDPGQTKIIVYKGTKVMDQYDVAYHPSNIQSVYFGDHDDDSFLELYFFTLNDTALFLSVIDPMVKRKAIVINRLIDFWDTPLQSDDKPQFTPVSMAVNPAMQTKDFIFYISTGYSLQPRNMYRYIIDYDSLVKSPESYATIGNCALINKAGANSENEFLLSTQATGNTDETAPYSDKHCWLMVLNYEMNFIFNPKQIGSNPSTLYAVPVNISGSTMFLLFYDYFGTDDIKSMFYIFNENGAQVKEKVIEDYEPSFARILANVSDEGRSFYFFKKHDGSVEQLDTAFNTISTYKIPAVSYSNPLANIDADMDGKNELFFMGHEQNSIVICHNNFKDAIEYKLYDNGTNFIISQVLTPECKPLIHLQLEKHGWLLSYEKNWLYYLQAPIYILFYFIVFIFISLIYRLQQHRLNLKTATGREIASLQMKAIRNQIDPHFTLNVLNSIGSLYLTEANRTKADYIFGKYATLIRQTVISSDKIIITLEEEIGFIKNYVDIERFRFANSFDYFIYIDPGVDMEMRIPRMLIYTFVENSVKHGLRKKSEGGELKIEISQDPGVVMIKVEDNGPGLINDGISAGGTGKGLKIVNELTDLYYRLEKILIKNSLDNIIGPEGEILGTKAIIELFLRKQ